MQYSLFARFVIIVLLLQGAVVASCEIGATKPWALERVSNDFKESVSNTRLNVYIIKILEPDSSKFDYCVYLFVFWISVLDLFLN